MKVGQGVRSVDIQINQLKEDDRRTTHSLFCETKVRGAPWRWQGNMLTAS